MYYIASAAPQNNTILLRSPALVYAMWIYALLISMRLEDWPYSTLFAKIDSGEYNKKYLDEIDVRKLWKLFTRIKPMSWSFWLGKYIDKFIRWFSSGVTMTLGGLLKILLLKIMYNELDKCLPYSLILFTWSSHLTVTMMEHGLSQTNQYQGLFCVSQVLILAIHLPYH